MRSFKQKEPPRRSMLCGPMPRRSMFAPCPCALSLWRSQNADERRIDPMIQAQQILTKDVRSLRYEIGVTLALDTAVVFFQVAEPRLNALGMPFLLVIAGWLLTVRVLHEEPLPGPRQFWLTRPYSRA